LLNIVEIVSNLEGIERQKDRSSTITSGFNRLVLLIETQILCSMIIIGGDDGCL